MPLAEHFKSFHLFPRNYSCPLNWSKGAVWGDTTLQDLLNILWLQYSVTISGDITVRYTETATTDPGFYSEYRLYGSATHVINSRSPFERICQPFNNTTSSSTTWQRIANFYNDEGDLRFSNGPHNSLCQFTSSVAPYKGASSDRYRYNCELRIGPFDNVNYNLDVITMTAAEYAADPSLTDTILLETTMSVLGITVPVLVTANYSETSNDPSVQNFSLAITSDEIWTFPAPT